MLGDVRDYSYIAPSQEDACVHDMFARTTSGVGDLEIGDKANLRVIVQH